MKAAAQIARFYWHGFRAMQTTGRTLWLIIIIKLIIIFGFLRLVFFQDQLHSRFDSDAERAAYVLDSITSPETNNETGGL